MKLPYFYFFYVLLFSSTIQAQINQIPIGAEAWASGSQATTQANVFSVQNNPAAITQLNSMQLGLYQEVRFKQKELLLSSISLVLPSKWTYLGLGFVQQGSSLFNQQKLSLSIAKALSPQLSMGINLCYLSTQMLEIETKHNFFPELGIYYQPSSKLILACMLVNPTQVKYKLQTQESIGSMLKLGIKYQFSNQLKVLGEWEHPIQGLNSPKLAFTYAPLKQVEFLLGYCLYPNYLTFGTSVHYKKINAIIAVSQHTQLGLTPHVSLMYDLKGESKK